MGINMTHIPTIKKLKQNQNVTPNTSKNVMWNVDYYT